MKFYFHREADLEFDAAVEYYEGCQLGLGLDFAEEVCAAIERIGRHPDAWTRMSENTRRCLVNRFPYGVIYQVKSDVIRVIAISNLNKKPGYWRDRI